MLYEILSLGVFLQPNCGTLLNLSLSSILLRFRLSLVAVFLATTFITICIAGPVGVYLALSSALVSLFFAVDLPYLKAALRDWGVRCFLIAFFLLWGAFILSAQSIDDVMGFLDFLAFPVIVPAFALLARHAGSRRIELVSALAAAGALAAMLMGLYEVKIIGLARATGGTSPIFFSGMAVLLSFFSLLGLLTSTSQWRWLLLAGNSFGLSAAILGGTRGAFLAYGVMLVPLAAYTIFWWKSATKERFTVAALVALSIAATFLVFDASRIATLVSAASEVATRGETTDQSILQRVTIYNAAIQAFLDSPVYGHGWWNRFAAAVPYMGQLGLDTMAHDNHAHLHNDILNFGSAAGIIGILAYLILMSAPIVSVWRSPRTEHWGIRLTAALGLTGAYMAMGAVDVMFVFEIPKSMFVLCSAVIMAFFLDAPPAAPRHKGAKLAEAG